MARVATEEGGLLSAVLDSLFPPILFKDVKMSLRTKRAALLQLVFLGACFLTAWVLWPQEGIYSLSSQNSHHLFTVMGIGQLAMMVLFSPAFTSGAFTMEKERNTFDLLYGTRMSPFAIVWGKISGALTFLIFVALSSVPVVCVCLVLGGINTDAILWFYVILVLTALFYGMVGLTVSAVSQKTYISIIVTYIIIAILSIGVIVPPLMFIPKAGMTFKSLLHHLWSISPFVAMTNVVQPELLKSDRWIPEMTEAHIIFAWVSAIATVAMALFLFGLLHRCPTPKPRRERVIGEALGERLTKWPFYLVNPRGHRRMIGRFSNPVFIKELRTMLFGRIVYLMRGIYFCVVVSMGLVLLAAFSTYMFPTRVIGIFTVSFQMVLILFMGPIFSAPLISSEIENGRFDLLRLTKLRSWTIVSGKFQSVIIPLAILLVATLPPYFALGYIDRSLIPGILRSGITLVATVMFICSAGMFFSSISRKTATSIAATYVVVVLTCVLSLVGLLAQNRFSPELLKPMFLINPVVAMLSETALPDVRDAFHLWLPNLKFLLASSVILLILAAIRVGFLVRPRTV
jgi:ABC-type transport system involved in multi-copper enzyme maturation permease subunit